jgi:azurin
MTLMRNMLLAAIVLLVAPSFDAVTAEAQASAKVCKLAIAGTDAMQFDKKELKVAADCAIVELTLTHTGKLPKAAMGHNWVLVKTPDLNAVTTAATAAGPANDYVPPKDARILAATKLVGGGESVTVKFETSKLAKGGAYTFVCTFPGHSALMKGKLVFG